MGCTSDPVQEEESSFDAPVRVRYAMSELDAMVPLYDISELEFPSVDNHEVDVARLFPMEIQEAISEGFGDEEKATLVGQIHFQ